MEATRCKFYLPFAVMSSRLMDIAMLHPDLEVRLRALGSLDDILWDNLFVVGEMCMDIFKEQESP